jgi:hypothetical protein
MKKNYLSRKAVGILMPMKIRKRLLQEGGLWRKCDGDQFTLCRAVLRAFSVC